MHSLSQLARLQQAASDDPHSAAGLNSSSSAAFGGGGMDYDSMSYNPNRQGSYSAPNGGGGGGGYLADFDPEGPAAPASAQQVRGFSSIE